MIPRRITTLALVFSSMAIGFGLAHCRSTGTLPSPPALAASSATVVAPAPIPPASAPVPGAAIEDERNTIGVFRRTAASTVFVTQKRVMVDFFGGAAQEVAAGSGSGFVWDQEGHVVTNFHVVQGAQSLAVTLQNQKTYDASVVGVEPRKDVAVLKIEAPADSLVPIEVARAHTQLEVGQKAIAIGNPFGLDHTLTTGVVSALGREVKGIGGVTIRDMVQTDAAINPGNSGGPLLDSSGRLIGMNTIIFSQSGSSAGIGFAVPVSAIARVVPQIIKTGHAEQTGMGIQIDPAGRLEQRANLAGVVVLRVLPGTPAEKAGFRGIRRTPGGIELGDVIVSIGGERIDDYDALYNVLDRHHPGDVVDVQVMRDGKPTTTKLELVALP